jgi:stage V sporulation protein B
MKAMSVALLFTPLVASMRGYYQGRQDMKPTGITEVVEQMIRVVVGLTLAFLFYKTSLVKAAAGATFGASAGIFVALIVMLVIYRRDSDTRNRLIESSIVREEDDKTRFKELIVFLVPITIGSAVMPIMFNIDAFIVVRRLLATGWDRSTAEVLYGLMGGYCDPIINLPNVFIDAICISLMPAVTTAFTLKNKKELDDHIKTGLKSMMIIAYPCTVGLVVLARPILTMLFYKKIDEALLAVPTMQILALTIVTLAIMRTFSTSLQGIGKMMLPVWNLFIGAIVKAIVSYILLGIPAININGAAAGSVIAYITAGILNYRALRKYAGVTLDVKSIFVRPLIAALIMGVATYVSYKLIYLVTSSNTISTMIAIMLSVAVYFVTVFKIKALTREEIVLIPKGDLIYRIAVKMRIAE